MSQSVTLDTATLEQELSLVLQIAAKTLQDHGIGHWKLSLIARDPREGHQGKWLNITNDDAKKVAATIVGTSRPATA